MLIQRYISVHSLSQPDREFRLRCLFNFLKNEIPKKAVGIAERMNETGCAS